MNPENNVENKGIKLRFAGLYLASVLLIVFIFATFWGKTPPLVQTKQEVLSASKKTMDAEALSVDALLHTRFNHLQQLDETYKATFGDSATATSKETNNAILAAEESLKKTLDSIAQKTSEYKEVEKIKLDNILTYFRTSLQNHRSISTTQNALANRGTSASTDRQTLLNYQNSLNDKDRTITGLQDQLKNGLKDKDNKISALQAQLQNSQKNTVAAPASTGNDLEKKNQNLRTALNTMENKNATLLGQNIGLRQENERLILQLNSLRKSAGTQ